MSWACAVMSACWMWDAARRGAVQVLRPGGRLRIVDDGAGRYAAVLRDAGCTGVAVRQLDWRTWYGLPGHHLTLVAAARPALSIGHGPVARPGMSVRDAGELLAGVL